MIHRIRRPTGWIVAGLMIAMANGCGSPTTVSDDYGKRRGSGLNGLKVLSEMFRADGSRTVSWKRLSPKARKQDTIIWAPPDVASPTEEQIQFFEEWLSSGYGRTLILIGSDYDAALGHWEQLLASAKGQQAIEIRRRLALAKAKMMQRQASEMDVESDWYDAKSSRLLGDWAEDFGGKWTSRFNTEKARIYAGRDYSFSNDYETEELLTVNGRPLITKLSRDYWADRNKVIIVANGSIVFNQPLVNRENRKLAAALINECDTPKRVMFLEGRRDSIPVRDTDATAPLMLRAFKVWPINFVLIHATLLGIVFCISVFPVFGRPRRLVTENVSDFGKHIAAYGEMLYRIQAKSFVARQIQQYREMFGRGPT